MKGLQRAVDNDTYPTITPGKHYSKVLLYVFMERGCAPLVWIHAPSLLPACFFN